MKINTLLLLILVSSFLSAQNNLSQTIHSKLIDLHQVSNNNEDFTGFDQLKDLLKGCRNSNARRAISWRSYYPMKPK